MGHRPERRTLARVGTIAAAASVIGAATVTPVAADPGTNPFTCTYTHNVWSSGFTADIVIVNSGPPIDGWEVRWTFAHPTTITSVWLAEIRQDETGVSATNVSWNGRIGTGEQVLFGWNGVAAVADIPTDLTVNGVPC